MFTLNQGSLRKFVLAYTYVHPWTAEGAGARMEQSHAPLCFGLTLDRLDRKGKNGSMRTPILMTAIGFAALALSACEQATRPGEEDPMLIETSPSSTVAAADGDESASWESLDGFVGKHPLESGLLDRSAISGELRALLGDEFATLRANLETSSALQREGSTLFTSGNKAHEGGLNAAYLLIDQSAKAIEVGYWENGRLSVSKTPGPDIAKPRDIQTIIANNSMGG